jgi:hypothetical protein
MVFRAAMPKSATKPTMAPMVRVPPASTTATTPPMSVLGNAKQHQNHVSGLPECQRQQNYDEHESGGGMQQQLMRGGRLGLRRSAVAQKHSRRQVSFAAIARRTASAYPD